MKSGWMKGLLPVLVLSNLVGCASVPKEAGFPDVRENVAGRAGYQVRWYRGAPEEEEVTRAVEQLLQDSLTVEEAVQIALLNNRRLQATYEELGVAQAAVVQAGLLRNPLFGGGLAFLPGAHTDFGLEVAVEFLDVFYIPLRKAIARSAFEAAKLRVAGEVLGLAAEVKTAFYRAQADEQLLEMLRQVALATEAGYDVARRLHTAGNIRDFDLQNEQALYEQVKLDLVAAELAVQESRERLNRLMGLWGSSIEWTMAHRLQDVPEAPMEVEQIEKQAVSASLDLAAARQEIETFGRRLGLTNAASLVPDVELGLEVEVEEGEGKRGPRVEFPIPLFDQGQARRAAARAELRQRQDAYVALAVDVRSAARTARQRLVTTRRMALHYRNVLLPLRSRLTAETQLQYNAMQVGIFHLLQAKQQEIEAGRRYIEALQAYWVARTEVDLLLQGRMPDLGSGVQGISQGAGAAGGAAREAGH